MKRILFCLCLFLLTGSGVVSADSVPTFDRDPGPMPTLEERFWAMQARSISADDPAFYIVLLDDAPLARYEGTLRGLAPTSPAVLGTSRLDLTTDASVAYLAHLETAQSTMLSQLGATFGRNVETIFHYSYALNGFAAWLMPEEADYIATLPNVTLVEREALQRIHTDAGPNWIEADEIWTGSSTYDNIGTMGENVVIGVIDTGFDSDSASFSDEPADGYEYSNPLGSWFGACITHPLPTSPCNDKLLGMYDFATFADVQDRNNHGSHTGSTAGGNALTITYDGQDGVYSADFDITGVAPHANVISYKACFDVPIIELGGCLNLATSLAIDRAVADGVDVINYSIGGTSGDPWSDSGGTAFLNALSANVLVAVSAGNDGPGPQTIGSPSNAPWVASVAATKHDRALTNTISGLTNSNGDPLPNIVGTAYNAGYGPAQVVYAGDYPNDGDAALCEMPFANGTFSGEIVICDRGVNARVDKCTNVGAGGAGGCILANDEPNGASTNADPHTIPSVHISYANGQVIKAYLLENPNLQATISATNIGSEPGFGDIMAGFSSRGPDASVFDVLKPDIGAPGVDILAAYAAANGQYGLLSGTSMSGPHYAGTLALMRSLHPTWSPTEVRSALMLTAFNDPYTGGKETHSFFDDDGVTLADPHDIGAGRVDMHFAAKAGFVLHETAANFESADPSSGGEPTTLNLASMSDGTCAPTCAFTRTLRSTLDETVQWTVTAQTTTARADLTLTPAISSFSLDAAAEQTVCVTAQVTGEVNNEWGFGRIIFTPDNPDVPTAHIPVAVRAANGDGETCGNFIPTDIGLQQMNSQHTIAPLWLPVLLMVALVGLTVVIQRRRRVMQS